MGAATATAAAFGAGAVLVLPGVAVAVPQADDPYAYAQDAGKIGAAANRGEAERLTVGKTYRSSIGAGANGVAYYGVQLDGAVDAYASVVAVPPLGSGVKAAAGDGISVSVQDSAGNRCDAGSATFRAGAGAYPRPIAAGAGRYVRPGGARCQTAGTYYVVVQRKAAAASTREAWGLELRVATEPGLVTPAGNSGPTTWPTESVQPPQGKGGRRTGGTGFNDARALTEGVWTDQVAPGQSHFYRVPVDWGQQLSVAAELSGPPGGGAKRKGSVSGALDVALFNPARASVAAEQATYAGEPVSAGFEPLPPVAYENRRLTRDDHAAMRLAGWYYVEVTLDPAMAAEFGDRASGVTLRVGVDGRRRQAPDYVRDPGEFQVTAEDRAAAERGDGGAEWDDKAAAGTTAGVERERPESASAGPPKAAAGGTGHGDAVDADAGVDGAAGRRSSMRVLGVSGVSTGTALVLGLGVWRLAAVRKARGRERAAAARG
jgi:hypothetical protein